MAGAAASCRRERGADAARTGANDEVGLQVDPAARVRAAAEELDLGHGQGDPALAGESESEEDVKIQHTKEDEAMWFYATSTLIPALVFVAGALRVSSRRKKGAA